jgi:hypothetical protein
VKVFISYSSIDLTFARKAKAYIESAGYTAYVSEFDMSAGTKLTDELKVQIRNSQAFVLLWSKHAKSSEWVSQEIGIAQGDDIPVIPVILDDEPSLPGFIANLKYVRAADDSEKALKDLRNAVTSQLEKKSSGGLIVAAVVILLLALNTKQ